MKLLAFDTSTEVMSIAVAHGARSWQHTGAGGARASRTLIPAIQALMAQAGLRFEQLDAIAFGRGPGSFTGLRTACSVAQGLAFGASAKLLPGASAEVKVLPIDTLLAVAEQTRFEHGVTRVRAMLDARMGEIYLADYEYESDQWISYGGFSLIRPENLEARPGWALAGNVFAAYGARLPAQEAPRLQALPTAAALLRLAPSLIAGGQAVSADQALPLYIRDKVAKTTDERVAERAALSSVA